MPGHRRRDPLFRYRGRCHVAELRVGRRESIAAADGGATVTATQQTGACRRGTPPRLRGLGLEDYCRPAMMRRFHRGSVFATLLLWQAGLALDGTAFASMPGKAVGGSAAHCHASTTQSTAAGVLTAGVHSPVLSDDSGATHLPACCGTDSCKCSAAGGSLAVSNAARREFSACKASPASALCAPRITERASTPFRPPI